MEIKFWLTSANDYALDLDKPFFYVDSARQIQLR